MTHWTDWKSIDATTVKDGDTVVLEDGTTARVGPRLDGDDGFVAFSHRLLLDSPCDPAS